MIYLLKKTLFSLKRIQWNTKMVGNIQYNYCTYGEQVFKITALVHTSQITQPRKWYVCYKDICNNNKCNRTLHSTVNDVYCSAGLCLACQGLATSYVGHPPWRGRLKAIKHATAATYDVAQAHKRLNCDVNIVTNQNAILYQLNAI
jgi:hypothetical protein